MCEKSPHSQFELGLMVQVRLVLALAPWSARARGGPNGPPKGRINIAGKRKASQKESQRENACSLGCCCWARFKLAARLVQVRPADGVSGPSSEGAMAPQPSGIMIHKSEWGS